MLKLPIAQVNFETTRSTCLQEIIDTNVYGTIICCREAIRLMTTQPAGGHVFNMEGAGSDGNPTRMYAAYGFSKAGMGQLSKSLTDETRGSHVGIHTLSPGIVYTDLLQSGAHSFGRTGRFFINAVAETPGSVARALVPKIRRLVHQPGVSRVGYNRHDQCTYTSVIKVLPPYVCFLLPDIVTIAQAIDMITCKSKVNPQPVWCLIDQRPRQTPTMSGLWSQDLLNNK